MTRDTHPTSTLDDDRTAGAALALALAALALLGAVAASPATAQSDQPTVRVVGDTVSAGDTTTVGVVLTAAPNGLSGYYLELALTGTDAAHIESASYPDGFGLTTEPSTIDGGRAVTLEAADMEGRIEPGATDVTLATVVIAGDAPGQAELTVEPRQFDDDEGDGFRPAVQPGAVTVTDATGGTAEAGSAGTAGGDADTTGADGAEATADASAATTTAGSERTTGSGPLSPALILLALGTFVAAVARRHRS